jgi:hypothetical protein
LTVALVALLISMFSAHRLAVGLVLIGVAGPGLNYLMAMSFRWRRLRRIRWLAAIDAITVRTDGKHQLNLLAYVEIVGFCAMLTAFSWIATDLTSPLRLGGLLAAVLYTTGVAHAIYADHTWFNPAESQPPVWHEILRLVAGPSTTAMAAGIALPAPWPPAERLAVIAIVMIPLLATIRIWDLDQTVGVLGAVVDQERSRGRNLVVAETAAALSDTLDTLELLAREHRSDAPVIHDLALHAKLRLRDTLALSNETPQPTRADDLFGPALTLARALGVATEVSTELEWLNDDDAQLASWVVHDLVGNALDADTPRVAVSLRGNSSAIEVSVADEAHPMPPGVWQSPGTSSARLAAHLVSLGGMLEVHERPEGKVVSARWLSRHSQGRPDP